MQKHPKTLEFDVGVNIKFANISQVELNHPKRVRMLVWTMQLAITMAMMAFNDVGCAGEEDDDDFDERW